MIFISCYKPNFIYKCVSISRGIEYKFIPHDKMNDDFFKNDIRDNEKLIPIPCHNCIGCKLDYARNWANRAYLESLNSNDNYFITLTYENPKKGIYGNNTLVRKDFIDFLKRLRMFYVRKYGKCDFKYLACGEYGSSTFRPHFHFIAFNLPIYDLTSDIVYLNEDGVKQVVHKKNNGDVFYNSDIIKNIWSFGNILIAKANWQTMNYVARYVLKGSNEKKLFDELGIESPFIAMSKGIAKEYYLNNKDKIYSNDNVLVYHNKPEFIKPPKYFDKFFEADSPEHYKILKNNRSKVQFDKYFTDDYLFSDTFNNRNYFSECNKEKIIKLLKKS